MSTMSVWQEIKFAVFIIGLSIFATLGIVAIYRYDSPEASSAWLLIPPFAMIAIAIFVSEVRRRQ
jgi:hypothetical protein